MKSKPCAKSSHPLYGTWKGMIARCHRPANTHFKYYGARGISVCHRWRYGFENFIADMGPKPVGTSIGRIDNDGDYEPSNCRWETPTQQSENQRPRGSFRHPHHSVRLLKLASGAGNPDGIPALKLDLVIAAEALYDAQMAGDYSAMEKNEERVERAIRSLRRARKSRATEMGLSGSSSESLRSGRA